MYLPKNLSFSTFTINSYYLPWLISFFVATTLILIILVIVIIICSSFKRKKKIIIGNTPSPVDGNTYIVNGTRNSLDHIKTDWINVKPDDIKFPENTTKSNCFTCCCCCYRNVSPQPLFEEKFGLLGTSKNVIKVDMREKERQQSTDNDHESMPDLSVAASDGISEHETGRTSHIDRELPPIPKIFHTESANANYNNSIMEPELASMSESENYNELKPQDETDTEQQNLESFIDSFLTMKNLESSNPSLTNVTKSPRSSIGCTNCCCNNRQDIISCDDLSSNDYDPTYAAIKRKKHSCQVCGVPSVYTPANSNRNSNLSLQSSSCLTSPTRIMNPQIINSLNNSTYASIAKLSKIIPEDNFQKDQDNSVSSSTIKRQRSISQGNIVKTATYNVPEEMQTIEIKINESNSKSNQHKELKRDLNISHNPKVATISLWSLMASNRNSPYSMFPLIPERTYGQSVVDLIEKLRKSERSEKVNKQSGLGLFDDDRSFTPPVLLNNSFKKSDSIINSKGRVWTPSSCQMLHGNTSSKSALYSPLKIFERNSNSYDFNFPDLIGSYRKGNASFQPLLTPPLSPLECFSSKKDDIHKLSASVLSPDNEVKDSNISSLSMPGIKSKTNKDAIQGSSVYEDLDYESVLAADKEIEVINNDINLYPKESDDYEYLLNSKLSDMNEIELIGYSDDTMISRTRPISIHLYGDDSLKNEKSLKYRFDKCEMFGFSSVQMSPLMEQSIENSSSKTTLSSLSFHQFNRLISSEDSCAKSPPSAELSPSLDNFEISAETGSFLYSDLMWSKLNSAFDDYDTFE